MGIRGDLLRRGLFIVAAVSTSLAIGACTQAESIPQTTATTVTSTPAPKAPTTSNTSAPPTTTTLGLPPLGGGGRIAYESRLARRSVGLFIIDPYGTDETAVGPRGGELATWSPDGSQLAYLQTGNSGRKDLYVINADGTNQRRLTDTPEEEGIPAWSPRGDTIAVSIPIDGDAEIYLLDAESGEIVGQLTDNDGIDDYMPAWSPDGSQIAYVARNEVDGSTEVDGSSEIHIMSADGAVSTQITDNSVEDYYPAWAPNGDAIAFVSARVGERTLFIMGIDGSNQRQLTDGKDRDSRPAWSPDGSMIAYHSLVDDIWSLKLIDVATGTDTLLVKRAIHPAWSP